MTKRPNTVGRSSLATDTSQWSQESKRAPDFYLKHTYVDETYKCRLCAALCVYTAVDQKKSLELKKASVYKRRILCTACWRESHRLQAVINECETRWMNEKVTLQTDQKFLEGWLNLLIKWEAFKPHVKDLAKANMLRKLLAHL